MYCTDPIFQTEFGLRENDTATRGSHDAEFGNLHSASNLSFVCSVVRLCPLVRRRTYLTNILKRGA